MMIRTSFLTVCVAGIILAGPLLSQEYTIQSGDNLSIAFWQQPDLNTETRVAQDGKIELPVVGRIRAAGLTAAQLSENIIEQISRYRINITQASVTITEYQGNKVFVTGQVGSPGTYSFEVIPNLWRVLQEAGGLLETADLARVSLIRAGEQSGNITQVDLRRYFEDGALTKLPRLNGGDTIHVPGLPSIRSDANTPTTPFSVRNEIYILGEVASPGRYNLEQDINLLEALILAGGPTNSAKLTEVKVLTRWRGNNGLIKINVEDFLQKAQPGPPQLRPGDTIYVPRKASNVAGFLASRILVPVLTSATVLILVDQLR
ncbi:MAG: polysaccharide biosynthesis/export family protein [bacterium]